MIRALLLGITRDPPRPRGSDVMGCTWLAKRGRVGSAVQCFQGVTDHHRETQLMRTLIPSWWGASRCFE